MECVDCGSAGVTERRARTAQGYRRYRCRACGRGINERSSGVLNRVQYPSEVIALVVLTGNMKYQRAAQRITSAVNCRPLKD